MLFMGSECLMASPYVAWGYWHDGTDRNGDHRADILWQNDNGSVAMWLMSGTSHTGGGVISSPSTDWRISGIGDFNGDGHDDILFRHDGGMTTIHANTPLDALIRLQNKVAKEPVVSTLKKVA